VAGPTEGRGVVTDLVANLQRIFRHALPGLLILAVARAGQPRWFDRVNWSEPWHLATLAVVAFVVGNTWYVLHRYTVEQALDMLVFLWHRQSLRGYRDWLIPHLRAGQGAKATEPEREYFYLRSAHTTYLFIMAEATALFSWAPQEPSFLQRHTSLALGMAVLAAVAALWQWFILDRLDCELVGTSPTRGKGVKGK